MSLPLTFAIIGCGKISPRHAAEAAKHGQLVAVCDIIPEKADALAKSHSAKASYHIDELLAGRPIPDLVAVCTPNGLHAEHTIRALQNGSHVLCEKPLCITVKEGNSMMEAAVRSGKKIFVVKSTRFNPVLAALKERIDSGKLGKVYSYQLNCFWNRPPEYYQGSWKGSALDGGTLYTQFSHYIDALLWLFGGVKEISGFRRNAAHEGIILSEDSGIVSLRMENNIIGGINWSVNSYRKNMEISLTVLAEKGCIRIGGEYLNEIEYQQTGQADIHTEGKGKANDYGYYKGSMSNHDKVYENLVKALQNEDHPFTSAADGLRTVELIERIYHSVSLSE
jgi:UDP-N-acetyl-2-amino-2-deoxyglucuronate dehydrogenase